LGEVGNEIVISQHRTMFDRVIAGDKGGSVKWYIHDLTASFL